MRSPCHVSCLVLLLITSLPLAAEESLYFSADSTVARFAEVREQTELSGNALVETEDLLIQADRIELFGDCVHALAAAPPHEPETLLRGVAVVEGGDPSERVRALAIGALAQHFDGVPGALCIRSVGRIPQLFLRGAATACPLSLAHHGRFAAWACALPPPSARRTAAPLEGAA